MAKITIFGLAGTGTSSVGKLLAEKLGYQFTSTGNIFRAKAASLGLSLYEFEELCNSDPKYDLAIDEETAEIGKTRDDFVIESRLAWHFIPDSIKIKLYCDDETRLKRVASRDNISFDEAKEKTEFREAAIRKRFAEMYEITNLDDDAHFDLVLNTTTDPIATIVDKIDTYLHSRQEAVL